MSKVTVRRSAELERLELLLQPGGRVDVSPRAHRLGPHLQQRGGDAPRTSHSAGAASVPPRALPLLSWGGGPGVLEEPPSPGCPAPALPGAGPSWRRLRRPCRVTAEASAPPGSGPSGQGTAVPDAPTLSLQLQVNALVKPQGCADKRRGDPGVSQGLLQILVILSLSPGRAPDTTGLSRASVREDLVK